MQLEALKFVRGAVSTKNLVPEMKHVVITDGNVRAFNGVLALSSTIDVDIACAPKADLLIKAIGNCEDVVSIGLTQANRLRIESGAFKAFIPCVELAGLPHQQPEGEAIDIDGGTLIEAFKTLSPFIGNDASRMWSNGILLRGQSAFATNNVCLVEYWLGFELPFTANIPEQAIREILRIGEDPLYAQLSPHSLTLHYNNKRWLRTQLFSTEWPDLSSVLEDPGSTQTAIPEELFTALDLLSAFMEDGQYAYFKNNCVATHREDGEGGAYIVQGLPNVGKYRLPMLKLLNGIAETADFSLYPRPVVFYGQRVRGAIMGLAE